MLQACAKIMSKLEISPEQALFMSLLWYFEISPEQALCLSCGIF
jgi:hypothetical protein